MFSTIGVIFFVLTYGHCQTTTDFKDVGIVGGHRISIEKVPYMASIRVAGKRHICGGSILTERLVLTAAHCINTTEKYQVLVGTDKLYEKGQLYDVEETFIHEKFSPKTFDCDICILKLRGALNFTESSKVKPIQIINKSTKMLKGTNVRATGWGTTQSNGTMSRELLQVKLPIVSRITCRRIFSSRLNITRNMICAGLKGKNTCKGDSGGPLTIHYKQVGITSCGAECGQEPAIFTRISALRPWIKSIIKQNS